MSRLTKQIIPILDLKREYALFKKEIDKELKDCFKTQAWILGPKVKEFEKKAAAYLGAEYAIGVASGTDALTLALRALALKTKKRVFFDKKDEIITTPFTFVATAEAIVRAGATPVFVDVDPLTYNIDPVRIKEAITKNTAGIIPVHLFGLPCDMAEIIKIAKAHRLFVVEDTAQAFGAVYKGKKAGTIAEVGAFSFFPSKNLGACGDGGLIVTNNRLLAESARILRNHGQIKKYNALFIGYNSRLDSIQAGILSVKLKYVDKSNQLRRNIARKYNDAFKEIKQIQTPQNPSIKYRTSNIEHVYHLYTIKVPSHRDELVKFLNEKGIGARLYYQILLNEMKAFRNCKVKGKLPYARESSQKTLSIPLHPFLKEREIEYIISEIKENTRRLFGTG